MSKKILKFLWFMACWFIFTSCEVRKPLQKENVNFKYLNSVILPTAVVDDASLIQAIDNISKISQKKLMTIVETNNSWQCGISFTVLPISQTNKLMRKTIKFHNLTIYEAFEKISTEFGLIMEYKYGRFIFSDPNVTEENELDLLGVEE